MRKAFISQTSFLHLWLPLERSQELKKISKLLDEAPRMVELVQQDLVVGQKATGAQGLAAEQVLRALIIKQLNRFSFRELAFHLADSQTFFTFCRLEPHQRPSSSALGANIKRLRVETLEQVNRLLLGLAIEKGVEDGSTVRGDCTVAEAPIHDPSDSALLVDGVRVLTHRARKAYKLLGIDKKEDESVDELRRAKRCGRYISTARKGDERTKFYQELLELTVKSLEMARAAQAAIEASPKKNNKLKRVLREIAHFIPLVEKVLDQTKRRVVNGEKVPSNEKILSLFEDHTDVVIKSWKETLYGHKVCFTTGTSSMVLWTSVLEGNPADATLTKMAIEQTRDNMGGRVPKRAVFDGSFSSRQNLTDLKETALEDVVFSKHRGIQVEEMTTDSAIFQKLRNFRAGIEGCISFLKRTFGWDRCTWRSFPSFRSYIAASAFTYNLLLLARALPS